MKERLIPEGELNKLLPGVNARVLRRIVPRARNDDRVEEGENPLNLLLLFLVSRVDGVGG